MGISERREIYSSRLFHDLKYNHSSRSDPFLLFARRWHMLPRLVFAKHLCPGQSGPNRHFIPMVTPFFVSINYTPYIGYYYILKYSCH